MLQLESLTKINLIADNTESITNGFENSKLERNVRDNTFTKILLRKNSNWFEGYNHPLNAGAALTNNGNEVINVVIKKEDTLRALLSLPEFLLMIYELVKKMVICM